MASSPITWACEKCGWWTNRILEDIASGPALVARFNERRPGSAKSGEEAIIAASQGNVDARDVIQSAGESFGSTVGLLVNVLDPEAVIIGGGLGLSEGLYWESFCCLHAAANLVRSSSRTSNFVRNNRPKRWRYWGRCGGVEETRQGPAGLPLRSRHVRASRAGASAVFF